jgi:hypothetical protein
MSSTRPVWGDFGQKIPDYDFEVINEREVRASAGILFAIGFAGYIVALTTYQFEFARGFAVLFLFDMMIRLTISPRYSPTLALGRVLVYKQRPEWVDAAPKKIAWWMGFGLALTTCFAFGWLGAPIWVIFSLCGVCMVFLFAEAALGICIGCEIAQRFGKKKPQLCPGDSCNYVPPSK